MSVFKRTIFLTLCLPLLLAAAPDGGRTPRDDEETDGFEFVPPPKAIDIPANDEKKTDVDDDDSGGEVEVESTLVKSVDTLARLDKRLEPIVIGIDAVPGNSGLRRDRRTFNVRLSPILQVPFLEFGEFPDRSEFKFGRLYFDATSLTLSALYTDNFKRSEKDRDDKVLFSTSLGLDLLFELTEESYLRINGALVWFPFEGTFGVDGYGAHDIYALGISDLFEAGLLLDGRLWGWDIIFQDDLVFRDSTLESEIYGNAALFGEDDFTEETDAGYLQFNDEFADNPGFEGTDPSDQSTEVINTVSLTGRRPLAQSSEFSLTAFYRNIWYINEPDNLSDAITRQYGLTSSWVSKREDWRFNPLLYYSQVWNNVDQGWMYVGRAGVYGPLTDQIEFYADAGVGRATHFDIDNELLYRASIRHIIGPLSRHDLLVERKIHDRARTLEDNWQYRFQQILNSRMRCSLFIGQRDSAYYNATDYDQDYWGAMLFMQVTPVVGFLQQYVVTRNDVDNGEYIDTDSYRATLTYVISKYSYLELSYEHRFQYTDGSLYQTFRENIVRLSWVYLL